MSFQQEIENAQEATKAKIEAINAIGATAESKNGWMTMFGRALAVLCKSEAGKCLIGEEVRRAVLAAGLPHPVHVNAWGAAISMGVRRKMLVETGRYRAMTTKASHARKSAEYQLMREENWTVG